MGVVWISAEESDEQAAAFGSAKRSANAANAGIPIGYASRVDAA